MSLVIEDFSNRLYDFISPKCESRSLNREFVVRHDFDLCNFPTFIQISSHFDSKLQLDAGLPIIMGVFRG